jgi:tryptophanyl-tRNA synthetase
VFKLHRFFSPDKTEGIAAECRQAGIGCVDCKRMLAANINAKFTPFREERAVLAANPRYVTDVLAAGAERAEIIARETIQEVKEAMNLPRRVYLDTAGHTDA